MARSRAAAFEIGIGNEFWLMTACDLQLAMNAHGKESITNAWMIAALQRSKKLKPLNKMTEQYGFKFDEDIAQEAKTVGTFKMMMELAKNTQPRTKAGG